MASVRVAVRVRPLNQREKQLSSKSIIRVSGSTTYIQKPPHIRGEKGKERVKAFSFDFSYDSSDKAGRQFASQEKVFSDLGADVLKAASEGFNTCVFAYGQTGSGKSFTMMGHAEDKGVIPRIGEGLFEEIANKSKSEAVSFRTEVSYLEIYNERVRDLLKMNKSPSEGGNLRVREHPRDGPYVKNLSKHLVHSYSDMEVLINLGNTNRTTASTAMNDVSSRSHAIFTITFMQAWFDTDLPRETLSKVHLVDLAGSERADATRATGTRLKEGANINKSLVTLGSVISTLAELSTGQSTKTKQVFIPYRDSVLTWLLKDSLGGNSKTTMIATVSPADVNYAETLSTLRYASRAKNIVNTPTVNEDDSVKIIRELQAEVNRLQRLLEEASQITSRELPSSVTVEEELHQNEAKVLALTKEWTSKWAETQNILQGEAVALRKEGSGVVLDCDLPHFIGIGKDLLSTGIILYHLKEGWTRMGSDKTQDIVLQGPELLGEHCVLENCAGAVTLIPQDGALCSVNGSVVTNRCQLTQGNIIQLGSATMLRFNHPSEAAQLRAKSQNGLMSAFSLSLTDLSKSTENLSKVMLQNIGMVGDKEKSSHQEEPRQQVQVIQSESTLDKKRQKKDGEVPSDKKEGKMTGTLVGETGNGLPAAVSKVQGSSASTEIHRTTAIGGKHPVALTSFKADEDKIEGGVSTREVYNRERDSCHKSRLGLMSERLGREAQNGATAPSYQKEEVWSGDASLQQTSVLGLGYGCSSKPEGNANEIQGVVADCYKGRPGSSGSSLGSMSHLQSGRRTGSMSVVPQTGTPSEMDKMPLSSQAPRRTPEQTVFEGQVCCGEMNESGHLKEVPGANMTETEEAAAPTGQRSVLGLFVHRVSWMVQDAGRLLLSPSTLLQTFRTEGLQPFGVYHVVSLVQESNVASVVKNSHVFNMVKRSFVFSLWKDNRTSPPAKELLPLQHDQTESLQPGPNKMSPGGLCVSSSTVHNLTTQTLSKAEKFPSHESGMPSTLTKNFVNLSKKQEMALIHIKQEEKAMIEKDYGNVSREIDHLSEKSKTESDLFVIQVLIQLPESLSRLQTLPLQDILNVLNSLISSTLITTQNILALFWLNVAKCSQPDPRPALLIMAETGLFSLTTDSGTLILFHYLPLLQLKEIYIALAGHSLRLMGTTEESVLGVYTHSQKITKELCRVILSAICPGDNRISQHPLLHGDLMKMSLDCQVYIPDLLMDAGLRVCSQFHRSHADLIYLLHCNMDHTGVPLGDIHVLLYFSVVACVSPNSQHECLMQLFLTDTSLGLVQVDSVFHPTLHCVTLQPHRPLFRDLTLRQRSDVRCVLLHDEDERGAVRLDVILVNTKGTGHSESVSIATNPSAKASNSASLAEVWKLTFSCSSDAVSLINHLSNV